MRLVRQQPANFANGQSFFLNIVSRGSHSMTVADEKRCETQLITVGLVNFLLCRGKIFVLFKLLSTASQPI